MNIYIMADMEGISGIVSMDQVSRGSQYYESEGRRYMTWDVNACIEGCLKGGVNKVIVNDVHSSGKNLIWEVLNPSADYLIGDCTSKRMPGIEECAGVILLGYHAMAGTPAAILEHTMNSREWQNFWINGRLSGEIAIDAGIAGDYNKPVIMVSGDDKTCAEAKCFLPDIVTAEVKQGLALYGGKLLSREAAHRMISERACEAVQKFNIMKPYKIDNPVCMRLEMVERCYIPDSVSRPYMKLIDGHTYEVCGNTVEEALFKL